MLDAARRVYINGADADRADKNAVVIAACRQWQGGPTHPWLAAFWLLTDHYSKTNVSRYRSLEDFAK